MIDKKSFIKNLILKRNKQIFNERIQKFRMNNKYQKMNKRKLYKLNKLIRKKNKQKLMKYLQEKTQISKRNKKQINQDWQKIIIIKAKIKVIQQITIKKFKFNKNQIKKKIKIMKLH